ncbi:hypothetical protein D9M71_781380 [compost metagenome]
MQAFERVVVEHLRRAVHDQEAIVITGGLGMPGHGRHEGALQRIQACAMSFQLERQFAPHRHHPLRERVMVHAGRAAIAAKVEGG